MSDLVWRSLYPFASHELRLDGWRYHYLDEIKFQIQARGSLAELLAHLNVCQDEDYLPAAEIVELKEQAKEVQRLLNGYIRFLRSRKSGVSPTVREPDDGERVDELGDTFNRLTF